ncbi:HlyD family secretion protein [Desulfosporosinus acidiphilus]|uniref:HlyD family secretion protein n=1 Tax=Desulfosporosinus acidiphilus TaxID=885581 RepID=UPI000257AA77|nr:HlyD family secretion protein [Desulfosporosinus acidiphilus]
MFGACGRRGDIKNPQAFQNQPLMSIMDFDSRVVETYVAEEFMKNVKLGALTDIFPQADKSEIFKGKITRISKSMIQKTAKPIY